ncbi:transketolase-like protein [Leptotrombidium deliense]|uniref:transketolase n=1 Tax=Leptotrombidium deliense TaxID=299467 RepID=A0A443S8M6_9ACAR|nr:transketolase-like protein [Leptotrombidium deliense]
MALDDVKIKQLQDTANRLRILSIEATNAAKSGHPTSCASMAEVMSVLFFNTLRYSTKEPKHPSNDRFVLSKGHAAPILYATWAEAGLFPPEEVLNLRKLDSDLEGHPTPRLNFVDVATGSLGQGLSVSAGMAYVGKYVDKCDYRVYCLIGDGESAEGSIWEAMSFSSHYKLNNLCAIFDVNRLGQSEPTALGHKIETYEKRIQAFGFETFVVNGHDVKQVADAFAKASRVTDKPQAIIACTLKGKGFPGIEDRENWHGKPLGDKAKDVVNALKEQLHSANRIPHQLQSPVCKAPNVDLKAVKLSEPPNFKLGDKIATRQAYGDALVKLGRVNDRVYAMDGDTKNSTFSETYKKAFPDRYIECFIAEQNLVGVGIGFGCRARTIPFVSTFACFLSRAFDQLRMGAISQANIKCVGSHCGVSIGEDGPSQMALEDIAMFRTIPGCTVFYPCDAVSTERAVELAAQHHGIDFIRTSRPATPVIYSNDTVFEIGKAKIVKSSGADQCLVIGAGITLHEAIKAADALKTQHGVSIRVMDPFTIKPIDRDAIISNAAECGNRIVVVEDHYPEGGIGEAVAGALADQVNIRIKKLAVHEVPRSGPPDVLVDKYGIGSRSIIAAVHELLA